MALKFTQSIDVAMPLMEICELRSLPMHGADWVDPSMIMLCKL